MAKILLVVRNLRMRHPIPITDLIPKSTASSTKPDVCRIQTPPEGDRATATSNMHPKFHRVLFLSDKQTITLITILLSSNGDLFEILFI